MRCIVTGGSGFIGSHVVESLRGEGHDVLVIDKTGENALDLDICDTEKVTEEFKRCGPDAVFHMAAVADARKVLADPVTALHVNVGGTASVLKAACESGVKRVILASTCWVAGAMGQGLVDVTSPFLPEGAGHPYTTSKIASEFLAHDFNRLYGLPFTILRYGIPYGPRMWQGLVLRSFLDRAFAGQPLTIFGDGSATRRFVYVEDLARAHVLALRDIAENQTYNLEGMRAVSVKELADTVARLLSGVSIEYKVEATRAGEFAHFRQLISNARAYVDLGWEPRVDLEEGVRRTVEWYRANLEELQKS